MVLKMSRRLVMTIVKVRIDIHVKGNGRRHRKSSDAI